MKKLLFVVCILLMACSSKQENVLRVNIGSEPSTLDPRKARDLNSMTLVRMFFDGLTRINQQEEAELALAEKVEISEDKKIYTFTLRPALWSNGEAVKATDFVAAWTKVLEPHFPADQAFQLYVLKNGKAAKEGKVSVDQVGVKALDDQTLQVELQYPIPYFLELTALPIFFPILSNPEICNGPFLLKEWRHGNFLRVVKNPNYWDAAHVKLNEIELMMVSEETELKMFEKGELDWAGSPLSTLPVQALGHLKGVHVKPFLGTYFFRTNIDAQPFQHPLIRKAFTLALKRSDIVQYITQGGQLPATGLVPPFLGIATMPYFKDGDIELAKTVFEEGLSASGWTRETFPPITLLYVSKERNHLIAQAVQQQWLDHLGVKIQLQAVERKVFFDSISKKNFQLAAGDWTADFKDGINFLEIFKFKSGGSNNTSWENPGYQELLDQALEAKEVHERQKILGECEAILMREMPIIPLFHYTQLYLSKPHVKDVVLSSLGSIDFKWAYVDERKE